MRRAIVILAAGMIFAAASAISIAAPRDDHGMGTLAGTVVNEHGRPVAGASVTMQNADGLSPHATTTNAEGRFFFPELEHGYYDVRAATKTSRSEWKHNIEIKTGKQTEVRLELRPKAR
jgi:hypothetical protein